MNIESLSPVALKKIVIFAVLFLSCSFASAYPVGDLNEDWGVNLTDLKLFMIDWLNTPDCLGAPGCADLIGNDTVDLRDLALLAENWMLDTTPTLVINEFMASNDSVIADAFGEYDDWIEIYNYGTDNIDMSGMELADDSDVYPIPSGVTINAGEYMIFWADKDKNPDQGPLHTNFKLNADGDEIYLYAANGTLIDSKTYNQTQMADYSYGRYPDNTDNWYTMGGQAPSEPTPESSNSAGIAGKVWFSRLSGTFIDGFNLELSTASPTATIRYTTNGSLPTGSSTAYSSPIYIPRTTAQRVRARVYEPTLAPGPIQSHYYIPLESDVQNFQSNLPIVIIDTYSTGIDRTLRMASSVFIDTDKDTGIANIQDVPDHASRAGIKLRGESSDVWPKKHYALELWDDNDIDTDASILGMPSESDWTLNNPYGDKTMLRNVLAYKWSNDIMSGFAAPGTKFVEVFVNDAYGKCSYSDYRGVYVLIEKIKVSKNRLDIGQLTSTDSSEPGITGGYILRLDKDYTGIYEEFKTTANMVTNNDGDGFQYYDPDQFTLTGTQKNWIKGHFNQFESVLNSSTFHDPVNGYAKYIDIESFIGSDIISEIFKEADTFKYSTYLYKERNGKIVFSPQWDFNFSSGNASISHPWSYPEYFARADTSEGWFSYNRPAYGWHRRLLADNDYELKTADKWFEGREDKLSDAQVTADIDYYYNLLDSDGPLIDTDDTPADRNFAKWNILNQYEWCNYYYGNNSSQNGGILHTYHMETEWLKNWFNGQGTPAAGESYSIYANYSDRFGNLDALWQSDRNIAPPPTLSIDGSPMNTGGNINSGSSLTMSGSSGTICYTTDGTDPREWTHWDFGDGTPPFSTMLLTENTTKKALVPTAQISDNWKGGGSFPDSAWTSVSGGVGYERSSGYEQHISYDVESLMYDTQRSCYIRAPFTVDAGDLADMQYMKLWVRFDDAFAAYINGTEVYSSSFVPDPLVWDGGATDYCPESTSLLEFDISAYKNELNAGSNNILAIHALNYGTTSSDFLISCELEIGAAGSGSGDELIAGGAVSANVVVYSGAITLNDTTQIKARIKNGSNWSALNEAVFSMNNVAPALRITEIMYHPVDPNDEFIEFKNIGPAAISLAHCQLTKGVDFTFPDMTLAPSAYTVAVRSIADFNSRYPGYSGTIAGEYTNDKLDNGGEDIRLKDAAGLVIQEFDYEDGWFPVTDGKGFSLNIIDPSDANLDNWNKRLSWQSSSVSGGTPGQPHTPNTVANDVVVINEVLTHTDDLVYGDWIELRNTTPAPVDIGNWYLSDDKDNLKKYKIASGTTIPANGYKVFTSVSNFRNNPGDPGCITEFGLSEHGEKVFLTSGSGSDIAGGYSISESFGAASNDDSFGRYTKSDGNVDFVQMTSQTRGYANPSAPYVPGVVITEIMYNARDIQDLLGEYIELYNRSGSTVYLYDLSHPSNTWKFTKGIEFEFPTGTSIPPGQRILISRALPAAFIAANGDPGVTVYGPFANGTQLSNDGEKIELSMPGPPDPGTGYVPYIRVEQVNYSDGAHPLVGDPWPTGPDARGDSLHRDTPADYSNDVANWSAATPTPGT